jgi:hypothetical protein
MLWSALVESLAKPLIWLSISLKSWFNDASDTSPADELLLMVGFTWLDWPVGWAVFCTGLLAFKYQTKHTKATTIITIITIADVFIILFYLFNY